MRKLRNRFFDIIATWAYSFFKLFFVSKMFRSLYIRDYEKNMPTASAQKGGKTVSYYTPSKITLWRVDTLFDKEPETIEWIDGFAPGDTLYDIGANVGMYTVYAAAFPGACVFAFEPESSNYAMLNRNIALNGLSDKVTAVNVALSSEEKLDRLHLSEVGTGYAKHNFGEEVDFNKEKFSSEFKQGAIAMSLDTFIKRYSPAFPTHIKIDVDGLEKEIIHGAAKTLADPRLKTLLIEINEELADDMLLVEEIKKGGLKLRHKKHSEMFETGDYTKIFNYIFQR